MAYFVNRTILRLHGGRQAAARLDSECWEYLNRMMMAKKLGRLTGAIGRAFFERRAELPAAANLLKRISYRQTKRFILGLEKKLRYLEHRGAIRIYDGKIHYTRADLDLGDQGHGVIDIVKTVKKAIQDVYEGLAENGAPNLSFKALDRAADELFVETVKLSDLSPRYFGFRRSKVATLHPLMHLESLDLAARVMLAKLNERGTAAERAAISSEHQHTAENIRRVEAAMDRVRRMSMRDIRREFDPKTHAPYTRTVVSANDFRLKPAEDKPGLVFVLSDVHLGPEPHPRTDDLQRFYRLALEFGGRVVHVGDYYDFFVRNATFRRVRDNNRLIMNAMRRMTAVLQIFGNHDLALKRLSRFDKKMGEGIFVPSSGTFFQDGVYFEHGHQADRHNAEGKKRGFYIVKLLSYLNDFFLIKMFLPNFLAWMEAAERGWYTLRTFFNKKMLYPALNLFRSEKLAATDVWADHKKTAIVKRIKDVFGGVSGGGQDFTRASPLLFIRGHDHGAGYMFTTQDVARLVKTDPELDGRVSYHSTGSWKGDDAYFLVLDYSHEGRVYAYPFVWESTYDQFVCFAAQK